MWVNAVQASDTYFSRGIHFDLSIVRYGMRTLQIHVFATIGLLLMGGLTVSAAEKINPVQPTPATKWTLDSKTAKRVTPAIREEVRRCLDLPTAVDCDKCVARAMKRVQLKWLPVLSRMSIDNESADSGSQPQLIADCMGWGRI